jgi:hypothetical protein
VTRTFIDSGILVSAARGTDLYSERALTILEDEAALLFGQILAQLDTEFPKVLLYISPQPIGMIGFEPTTPSSRTRCATKLRYIPVFSFEF